MRSMPVLVTALALGVLAAGCASPKPQDLRYAEDCRRGGAALLASYAAGMSAKDADAVLELIPERIREALRHRVAEASWLSVYSGYEIEAEAAVEKVSWKKWRDGAVRVRAFTDNAYGERARETFELRRVQRKWYLAGLPLAEVFPGAELDPPAAVKDQLRPLVAKYILALAESNAGVIHVALPKEAQYRASRRTFWQRVTFTRSRRIAIADDVRQLKQLNIRSWPDADKSLPIYYAAPGKLMVHYQVPYNWPQEGINELDTLDVMMVFQQAKDGWELARFILQGKAI